MGKSQQRPNAVQTDWARGATSLAEDFPAAPLASRSAPGPTLPAPPAQAVVGWSLAAGAVLLVGLSLRLILGGGGLGDRSAILMMMLLSVGAWLAALLLSTPRVAFGVTLAAVALLGLAAAPARYATEYDDRQAFFRTDQVVTAHVPPPANPVGTQAQPLLVLLVEPVFPATATQPQFGLAGDVGSAGPLAWDCPFQRGLQHLALPLPAAATPPTASDEVRLHLTGSPSRETDYLLVFASAPRGGYLASVVGPTEVGPGTTVCRLAS